MQYMLAPPPTPKGDDEMQSAQIYRYLFSLSEQLNAALTATDAQFQAVRSEANSVGQSVQDKVNVDLSTQYSNLKSLIIKTADLVYSEMDLRKEEFKKNYVAKSEWGTYQESIKNTITSTAEGILENYDYDSKIDSVADGVADFESYRIETNGYIRRGIIGYDAQNIPIIGIAIGQDLRATTVTVGGVEYAEIDMTRSLATYTSDRVTFWQNGVAIAYFSSGELVVTRINVADKIALGGVWEISRANGFTIKWIGD